MQILMTLALLSAVTFLCGEWASARPSAATEPAEPEPDSEGSDAAEPPARD